MKNELINLSLPPAELSCLVEGLILCGRTPAGREAMLLICRDRCTFIGCRDDLNAARNGKCPNRRCPFG